MIGGRFGGEGDCGGFRCWRIGFGRRSDFLLLFSLPFFRLRRFFRSFCCFRLNGVGLIDVFLLVVLRIGGFNVLLGGFRIGRGLRNVFAAFLAGSTALVLEQTVRANMSGPVDTAIHWVVTVLARFE